MQLPFMGNLFVGWRDILDILLVTLLIYKIIMMVRGTRVMLALHGLFLIVLFYLVTRPLGLNTVTWILENFLESLVLIVIIIFQKDIRLALTYMGSGGSLFGFSPAKGLQEQIDSVAAAALFMAQRRIGALIVFERHMPLGDMISGGTRLDAKLSRELLISLFWVGGPLHDGAVLLREGKISEAGCILPLSTQVEGRQDYGTRHRAAMGVTEETDAVTVVVSEEQGTVRISTRGRLTTGLDEARLKRVLYAILGRRP